MKKLKWHLIPLVKNIFFLNSLYAMFSVTRLFFSFFYKLSWEQMYKFLKNKGPGTCPIWVLAPIGHCGGGGDLPLNKSRCFSMVQNLVQKTPQKSDHSILQKFVQRTIFASLKLLPSNFSVFFEFFWFVFWSLNLL